MIVRIRLFRSRVKEKLITHEDVQNTTVKPPFYIVQCESKRFKYPIANVWEIEEDSTSDKQKRSEIQTTRLVIHGPGSDLRG